MCKGETVGSAATQGMGSSGHEPPAGNSHPTPVNLKEVEGCFDSLAGVVATESATLAKLVKANAALAASNATLTTSNATLTASNAKLTKALDKSKGGGGGGGGGGGKRREATYYPNCKHDTRHKADDCFEPKKNEDKRPSYWKTACDGGGLLRLHVNWDGGILEMPTYP